MAATKTTGVHQDEMSPALVPTLSVIFREEAGD
jgi:hypothetical protein